MPLLFDFKNSADFFLKKRRAIVARKQQNIEKLEINELMAEISGIRTSLKQTL
jgi:hypothetical protein